MRAVVAGALANKPSNGGNAWTRLAWLLGLRRLGLDVSFVERIERASADARRWFDGVLGRFGIPGVLLEAGADLPEALHGALLVDIGGHLGPVGAAAVRVFFDDDPGYTQLWHAQGLGPALDGYEVHYTVGTNVGRAGCPVPTG